MKYEIFISYKHSDENGNLTLDFEIAKELYETLVNMGYDVFFSNNTLEEIGSSRYKADINEALDSVKIMVVVLSKAEYAKSHWVEYEWDSFHSDFLSGKREKLNLFTLTTNVNIHDLPRTLREVQNFIYREGLPHLCESIKNIIPFGFSIITGKDVTHDDIEQAVFLDSLVYDDVYHVDSSQCDEWFVVNPDIYVMAKDLKSNRIIAYINVSPITDECYDRIKEGYFIDTGITADMLLSYDMPFAYSIYFSSIAIHPDYRNTEVFSLLVNAIVDKFINLSNRGIFIRRMIADAVSKSGEKFCKMFGMSKIVGSNHDSTLYEITMIPPKFRIISKKTRDLCNLYQKVYEEESYLFEE